MKTLRLLGMAFTAILMCVNFASCSNEDVVPDDPNQDKYITVGLNCVGDFLEIKDSPLSRNTINGVCYINVHQLIETKDPTSPTGIGTQCVQYASGTFKPSLENIKIKLVEGLNYGFEIAIVMKDVNKYDTDFSYSYEKINVLDYIIGESYYGKLDSYTANSNNNISINTKCVSYGAHFIAENLTEGKLDIIAQSEFQETLTPSKSEIFNIYSFPSPLYAWNGIKVETGKYNPETNEPIYEYKDYEEEKSLFVNWTKDNGDFIALGKFNVRFKRNVKTTIRIKLDKASETNAIGINLVRDDKPMSDDKNEYVIEDGEVTIVPLNSSQS